MTVAFTMGGFMVVSFILTMTTEGMGLPASLQPLVLLASGAGAIVGNQLGGQLVDRIGSYRTQLIMIIVHVISLVSLPLIAQLPDGWVAPAYLVMRGVAGVAGWAFFTAQLSNLSVVAPASASLAISINSTALNLGVAAAAILGGIVLEQFGVLQLGLVGGLIVAVALPVILLGRPRAA